MLYLNTKFYNAHTGEGQYRIQVYSRDPTPDGDFTGRHRDGRKLATPPEARAIKRAPELSAFAVGTGAAARVAGCTG